MKTATEIIEAHSTDGQLELEGAISEMQEGMRGKFANLTLQDLLALHEEHFSWAAQYLGQLVLQIADEVGALPNGFQDEMKNLMNALTFDKTRRIYERVRLATEKRVVLPGE